MQAAGTTAAAAVAAGALLGPAQVGARILEFGFLRRVDPLVSARIAVVAHPVAVLVLFAGGAPMAAVFVLMRAIRGHYDKVAREVAVAPADAHPSVLAIARYVTRARGGEGVLKELSEALLAGRPDQP